MKIKSRNSPATQRALRRVANGASVHGSAIKEGISPSTLFRALKRIREKELTA